MAGRYEILRRSSDDLPRLQTRVDMNPTLLVSWFCTIFSLVIILIRLLGRWVRTERLFREDKVMFYSIIPLLARMGFVHVILLWGTNNTITTGLTAEEIRHRMIGSKLVLPSRILYAAYIWIAKITVVEFLQRLIGPSWIKSYERGLRIVYAFLALTFAGVVISTLAECQPFDHYWQVVPDPGPSCRSAKTQLITMGVCDIATDVVLIVFPIPLVLMSSMRLKRKISLVFLFLLSIILIAITAYRVPSTISRKESQQYRSLLASLEILAATGVANAIAIGSFVRDRGVKKAKFRAGSVDESVLARSRSRSITHHHWGSDEDLVRDLGLSLQPSLRHGSSAGAPTTPRPTPVAMPLQAPDRATDTPHRLTLDTNWNFKGGRRSAGRRRSSASDSSTSTDIKLRELDNLLDDESPGACRTEPKLGFFDVGGLIDKPSIPSAQEPKESPHRMSPVPQPGTNLFLSDVGGLLDSRQQQDDEIREISQDLTHADPAFGSRHTEDFRQFLRGDSPFRRGLARGNAREAGPVSRSPARQMARPDDLDLEDAGGLLR